MILSVNDVLRLGLQAGRMTLEEQQSKGRDACVAIFMGVYGSSPEVVQSLWNDLSNTTINSARIPDSEKNQKGVKSFFMGLYLLWVYPKNARCIELHFSPVAEKSTRGEPLWIWVRRFAALLPSKIKWLPHLNHPNGAVFIVSVDGTDCKAWERRNHPTLPYDPAMYSHKFKHGGYKYEVAVAVYEDQIVWVSDVSDCGRNDLTIFRDCI